MREDILFSHLTKSEFSAVQAETLSKILSEIATKSELVVIRESMATKSDLAEMKTDLMDRIDKQTRWMVTLVLLLATLLGLPATVLGLLNYLR